MEEREDGEHNEDGEDGEHGEGSEDAEHDEVDSKDGKHVCRSKESKSVRITTGCKCKRRNATGGETRPEEKRDQRRAPKHS